MSFRNLLIKTLPLVIIAGFVALGLQQITADRELKLENQIELQRDTVEIELERAIVRDLKKLLKEYEEGNKSLEQTIEEKEELLRQKDAELQAKKQREAQEAERIAEASRRATLTQTASASPAVQSYEPSGNKDTWLRASGIPESEWWAVDYIVSRESGWNPCAYNPGKSNCNLTYQQIDATWATRSGTACGLAQSLPCSKLGNKWNDPVYNLRWQYNYVKDRYGGYPQAVAFWRVNHWY